MPEPNRVLRLAAQLARGRAIDWDAEERSAATDEERAGIQKLRAVAAMSHVSRALMAGAADADVSASVSEARSLAGNEPPFASPGSGPGSPGLAPGSRWGLLEVHERIGGGSFGDVYRARDTRLDREVALKILSRDASDPRAEAVSEARLLARVRHPNVVMVHGADRIGGRVGIWTEFLRGRTLDQVLKEQGPLDPREAALIGIDLCRALSAVHAAGIVHQDVKLGNVMSTGDGRIVLMDFGLGREAEPGGRPRGGLSGTPLFMAPEVLGGGLSDVRSDLYSLGVVVFALVTGSLPVEASTIDELRRKHARRERREARDLRPDLPAPMVQFLRRALAHDPEERFGSAVLAERSLLANLEAAGRGPEEADRRAVSVVPHRLPVEMDAFVGRDAELAELKERLSTGARLVTLLGTGGIGKTRLAVRYGWSCLEEYPGGVWFCDLTEAKTTDGIASAVAQGLGVPLGTGNGVEQLGHAIASRGPCLVLLDNFEQVAERAPETVEHWLARSSNARFIVTSRERLKISGESVQDVEALTLEQGIELFVDRGRRQKSIESDESEAESVREIVRLLEGIPLAIELSAARLRVMTPAQMVDRIAGRFQLLSRGGGGRHATLRATMDGSWELLHPWEKAAFAQCSVFEGGFGLDSAEAVIDLSPWSDAPWVVDVIQSLVDKSLLRSWVPEVEGDEARPAMRFGMFVSLQQYAREKLEAGGAISTEGPGAALAAERRHAQWFAGFGRDAAISALDRHGGVERRRVLARELDNLVAACRRMAVRGEGEPAVAAYRAASAVFDFKGPHAMAVELGRRVQEVPLAREDRARLLIALGNARLRTGRVEDVRGDYEAALTIARELGDRPVESRALGLLATLRIYEGRVDEGRVELEAAITVHREVGDRRAEGDAIGNLGLTHFDQGRLDEAGSLFEAGIAIHREIGNRRSEGTVLASLGNVRQAQGRPEEARTCFQAALAIHREVGNRRLEGSALGHLGSLCAGQGRTDEAREHYGAALAIFREVGDRRYAGVALDHLADLYLTQGRLVEAHDHFGEAIAVHRDVGNRRAEGSTLVQLSRVSLAESRIEEAREHLSAAEPLLRGPGHEIEFGKLLCARAELEIRTGDTGAARNTLAEAGSIADRCGDRPDGDLGRRIEDVRRALAAETGRAPDHPSAVDSDRTEAPLPETGALHRLPAETDAFVGREPDLAAVAEAFSAGARLVTLVGTGGIGKTRLAVRYAWRSLPEWPGGVWFCDLTEARTKDGIAAAVGEGLGVPLGPGDVVEQLGHVIAGRGRCLVILDNFEQVVERASEIVAPWLKRAGEARILVTSRERLRLPGEIVQPIDALSVDQGIELFVERGRRQRPIELAGPEAESVGEIVRLLEGIPLAIELSAARLRVMTPAQMVDRITERFRILAGPGTGRHATLRAAIDGSWESLKPWEKAAFAQCAVFEGGFGLDAAEGVLDLGAWPEAPWVVDIVQSLVDKSLLRSWVPNDQRNATRPAMRFGMFVSLQEFARERLDAAASAPAGGSDVDTARTAERRHARWFARFGQDDAILALDRPGGVGRRRALEPELDNLVTACRRMVTLAEGATAVDCYRAAWAVLELKGPLPVAVELGRRILEISIAREHRSRLLYLLGQAEQRSGHMKVARSLYEEALAIDRERGDRLAEGRALARLASVDLNEGRIEEANARHEVALAIHREVGDRRSEGITLGNMGLGFHERGRLEEAAEVLEASLAIHRETGNHRSEGIVLGNLGDLFGVQGRTDEALAHLGAALVIHRKVGNRRFEGIVLANLGSLYQRLGRMNEAQDHFRSALAIHRQVGARRFEGEALDNLAGLLFALGEMSEARTRFAEALAIHREVGNQRGEGIALGRLARLFLEEGRPAEARTLLSEGEPLLRAPEYRTELGKFLCTKAELEHRAGDVNAARNALAAVEAIARESAARPDPEFERRLADVRRKLAGASPG